MKPSSAPLTRHASHTSGENSLNTPRTTQKRKRSEADLKAEDITLNNPIWAAAEKGTLSPHIHTSKTALQLIDGLDGALSKDMARIYLTVHALRGAIRAFEIRKREQYGHLKPDHHKDMMNLKRRLVAAERRERRQKSKEEKALEKMLNGFHTPNVTSPKRRKPSKPDSNMSKPKPMGGSVDKVCGDGVINMIDRTFHSQGEADTTDARDLSGMLQQEAAGATVASKIAVTAAKNDPDGQGQSSTKGHPSDDRAEKFKAGSQVPERPCFSLADLQAKFKSDEDKLMQKYRQKPNGMSLSAWCTQQGLPKQRPAGRDPFPIKKDGLKRNLEAMITDGFDIEKSTKNNNKRQKLETSVTEQLPPVERKVAKLKGPSQGYLLSRQSLKNATSKHLPPQSRSAGTTSSRAGESRHETIALETMINASLVHEESDVTHGMDFSTNKSYGPAQSSSSPLVGKIESKQSDGEATASRQLKAHTALKPSSGNTPATVAMPEAMKPSSEGLMQALPSQNRMFPTADIDHNSPSWDLDEVAWCEDGLEIPSSGSKEYDRYVDSMLEEYLAEKEVEAKQAKRVDKTPSEDPKRIKASEALMTYTASLLEYTQEHRRRYNIHKKNIQYLAEEDLAVNSAQLPARPELPPMVGHEIAAKVHLEGTWSHAKHRFRIPSRTNGKIEPIWKSPESRPSPPNPRSSAIYQQLRSRELYKMGPKRARTRYVPPRPILQSSSAVNRKTDEG